MRLRRLISKRVSQQRFASLAGSASLALCSEQALALLQPVSACVLSQHLCAALLRWCLLLPPAAACHGFPQGKRRQLWVELDEDWSRRGWSCRRGDIRGLGCE